ncbi:hypothetical protein J6590_022322 [Homalodisca vitripennis]|nr:hypothetical protein J6590_022322 [Homalodisca vitripennis]
MGIVQSVEVISFVNARASSVEYLYNPNYRMQWTRAGVLSSGLDEVTSEWLLVQQTYNDTLPWLSQPEDTNSVDALPNAYKQLTKKGGNRRTWARRRRDRRTDRHNFISKSDDGAHLKQGTAGGEEGVAFKSGSRGVEIRGYSRLLCDLVGDFF